MGNRLGDFCCISESSERQRRQDHRADSFIPSQGDLVNYSERLRFVIRTPLSRRRPNTALPSGGGVFYDRRKCTTGRTCNAARGFGGK